MTGHRGHLGSKPAREIFLTSSSLSFSSLSSSCASWDDETEPNTTKNPRASFEEKKGKHSKASSGGSETSGVTHVRMSPASSPLSRLPPLHMMNRVSGTPYDPERIPASVFGKTTADLNWSGLSSESLFSLRMSSCQAFSQSNVKSEEFSMSSDYLAYSPCLLVKPEDVEEERSQVEETRSGVSSVHTISHGDKSSSTPPAVSWSFNPSSSDQLNQAPPKIVQSFSLPVAEKKSKKRKKARKSENKEKKKKNMYCILSWLFSGYPKKKKNMCYLWSWLVSGLPKCECNLCYYKWTKCGSCCRGPKALVL